MNLAECLEPKNMSRQVWHRKRAVHSHKLRCYSQLRKENDKHRANTRESAKPRQRAQNTVTRRLHNRMPETIQFPQQITHCVRLLFTWYPSPHRSSQLHQPCTSASATLKFPTLDQCCVFIIQRLNTLHTNQSTRGYVHKEAPETPGSTRAATRHQQSPHSPQSPRSSTVHLSELMQWNEIVVRSRNIDGVQLTECFRDEFDHQHLFFFPFSLCSFLCFSFFSPLFFFFFSFPLVSHPFSYPFSSFLFSLLFPLFLPFLSLYFLFVLLFFSFFLSTLFSSPSLSHPFPHLFLPSFFFHFFHPCGVQLADCVGDEFDSQHFSFFFHFSLSFFHYFPSFPCFTFSFIHFCPVFLVFFSLFSFSLFSVFFFFFFSSFFSFFLFFSTFSIFPILLKKLFSLCLPFFVGESTL